MANKNIKKLAVTFNMNDRDQAAMYNYLTSFPNVSGKIKRIIWSDMNGIVQRKQETLPVEVVVDEEIEKNSLDIMF